MIDSTALYQLSYGLYIISSSYEGKKSGCVANTLNQITSVPEKMSVTLNKNNFTTSIIEKSGYFTAVVLSKNVDMSMIGTFGFKSGKDEDKFKDITYGTDNFNLPYPMENVTARFTCKVVKTVDVGTHVMFIGELVEAVNLSKDEVMTYAYYHTVKKGVTPENAPSYQKPDENKGWRCMICGYIYEGDILPDDYICPICGATADKFEKL